MGHRGAHQGGCTLYKGVLLPSSAFATTSSENPFWEPFRLLKSTARRPLTLSFLSLFFWKNERKTTKKKKGFFIPTEPLKSLEKKGKTLKKSRNSSQGNKKRKSPKTKERKDRAEPFLEPSRNQSREPATKFRGFEKGLADRGGWRKEILPIP